MLRQLLPTIQMISLATTVIKVVSLLGFKLLFRLHRAHVASMLSLQPEIDMYT